MTIKNIFCRIMMAVTGFIGVIGVLLAYLGQKSVEREVGYRKEAIELKERYYQRYELLNQWLTNQADNKSMQSYFQKNNIKKAAIYGIGTFGKLFLRELEKTDVTVAYVVDKNLDQDEEKLSIPLIGVDEISKQEDVDVIIVTPVYYFDEIADTLQSAGVKQNILSLRDVIFGL